MAQEIHKVVLCGHYGSTNIGDEAIGLSMVNSIHKSHPEAEIVVLSYDKQRTEAFYQKYFPDIKIKAKYLLPLGIRSFLRGVLKGELGHTLKEIKTCDRFVMGGGGLFTDEKLFAVFLWGLHARVARRYKKPVYMIGQSVGPLKTRIGKWVVKKVFKNAKHINLRDEESKILLEKLKINKEIIVSCDPVFGLKFDKKISGNMALDQVNKKVEQRDLKGYFVFTIRPWKKNFEKLYTKFIHQVCKIGEKYQYLPVFIPFQLIKENDMAILNKIIVQKSELEQIDKLEFNENIDEVLGVISQAKFTFGVRLHSLLFSMLVSVPFFAFSYSPKIDNLLKMFKLENYGINDLAQKDIEETVNHILSNDDEISRELSEKTQILKTKWFANFNID